MGNGIGRPRSCECGECKKCKQRIYMANWYANKTPEERRALVAKRDRETTKKNDRARYYRDWEKRRAAADKYQKEHWDKVVEAKKKWAEKNPEKRRAQWAANNAVRDGKLIRQPCEVCGATERIQKHHDDYSKPLEVRWLCIKHHAELTRKHGV